MGADIFIHPFSCILAPSCTLSLSTARVDNGQDFFAETHFSILYSRVNFFFIAELFPFCSWIHFNLLIVSFALGHTLMVGLAQTEVVKLEAVAMF